MDWVREFYSRTGSWWGNAEATITERDRRRVRLIGEFAGGTAARVLELGSGYGTTAAAAAQAGHVVTAVEVSDRVHFASRFTEQAAPGSLAIVHADFYDIDLPRDFDVVCYWSGFGVGSDADQHRLLTRIASQWLRPGGVALVDVFNPFVWARWDGDEEHLRPDPAAGYDYELREAIRFDPVTCTAIDTWWPVANPDGKISQLLRCYTPADLSLLLTGTGLALTKIHVGEHTFTLTSHPGLPELLQQHPEYLTVLRSSVGLGR